MESKSRHYQYMALVETHVHTKADLRDWESASRQLRLRLHYNAARPSGKKVSKNKASCSNEGGEFFLAQAHLQAYKLAEAHVAAKHLRDGHHRSLDGFLPMVLQFSGYSVAYIVLYGHPTIQMSGKNRLRFQRIGAVLQALKMPWVLCGDFNMTPATLLKSEFPQRLDAVIRTADVVGTCSQKKDKPDTMIDYVLCSKSALPFIRDIVPVVQSHGDRTSASRSTSEAPELTSSLVCWTSPGDSRRPRDRGLSPRQIPNRVKQTLDVLSLVPSRVKNERGCMKFYLVFVFLTSLGAPGLIPTRKTLVRMIPSPILT